MMLLDYCRQALANKLGGWKNATATHYNVAVYRAKCRVIDTLSDTELAKAEFKEIGNVGVSSANNAVQAQQAQLTLDDIV